MKDFNYKKQIKNSYIQKSDKYALIKILDSFDFTRVNEVMIKLNWEWFHCGVPSIYELKKHSCEYLIEAAKTKNRIKSSCYVKSGGLCARYDNVLGYSLSFEICSEDRDCYEDKSFKRIKKIESIF